MNHNNQGQEDAIARLKAVYAQAANQCGVSLWQFDFATRAIYDFNNATHIKAFENLHTILDVPSFFSAPESPLHPDDVAAFSVMFQQLFAGAPTAKSVGRWRNDEHDVWWWYEISYTTLFREDGTPETAIGTAIDITERVRLQERYNEEIKWRKVHNQDVLGSFKMNLTQNTCEDGQSDLPKILSFRGCKTVDAFFAQEYSVHIDPEDLVSYRERFNRASLLLSYQEGKTSVVQESYVCFETGKFLWVKVEVDLFLNPDSGDIEAYIYALDIDQKKTARALVDAVVNLDYDFLGLLDAANDTYTIFAKTDGGTVLPDFYSSNYEAEVAQFANAYMVEEDIAQNIHDMSYQNIFAQLESQRVYTTFFRVREPDGRISRKKIQFS
ncbi:MAG: hypothetical protein RSC08_04660, partial [Oscillospiraceae bacterium]